MVVASEQHLYQTIVQFDKTIVLPRKLATESIYDYLFSCCPLVGILFEVLRIGEISLNVEVRYDLYILHCLYSDNMSTSSCHISWPYGHTCDPLWHPRDLHM